MVFICVAYRQWLTHTVHTICMIDNIFGHTLQTQMVSQLNQTITLWAAGVCVSLTLDP